jgi:hypothetical protein
MTTIGGPESRLEREGRAILAAEQLLDRGTPERDPNVLTDLVEKSRLMDKERAHHERQCNAALYLAGLLTRRLEGLNHGGPERAEARRYALAIAALLDGDL